MWRRYVIHLIRCLIVLIILGTASMMLGLYPAMKTLGGQLAGSNSCVCPISETIFRFRRDMRRNDELTRKYTGQCHRVETDSRGFVLWRSPKGEFWLPSGSGDLLPHLLAEEERAIYGSAAQGVRKGDVVLDCGAHVGVFVRAALSAGADLVVAIEPAPENLECLRRNVQRDIEVGKVIVCPKGVWNKEDTLTLHLPPANSAGNSLVGGTRQGGKDVSVPLTTIDNLTAALQLKRVDFIKMDIEGAEVPALFGADNVLRRFRPRLAIASYHIRHDPQRIPAAVLKIVPDYRVQCPSYTVQSDDNVIIPETLLFQ